MRVRAGRFGGFKFRRQQPLGAYIVDFVCQQAMLVVELDGAQHVDHRDYDQNRDQWLVSQGYRVFRVWSHEWLLNQEAVLEELWALLHNSQPSPPTPLPRPLSPGGRGRTSPRKYCLKTLSLLRVEHREEYCGFRVLLV